MKIRILLLVVTLLIWNLSFAFDATVRVEGDIALNITPSNFTASINNAMNNVMTGGIIVHNQWDVMESSVGIVLIISGTPNTGNLDNFASTVLTYFSGFMDETKVKVNGLVELEE